MVNSFWSTEITIKDFMSMVSPMDLEDTTGKMAVITKENLITGIEKVRARCSKRMGRTTKVNPLIC
jgi:hypothetical protein